MKQTHVNESVSAEIRAEMGRQKLTQQELARRLGWAPSQLSRRLSGITWLTTDDIDRIADELGIPRHQLMSPRALAS